MEIGLMSLGDHLPNPNTGEQESQGERIRSIVETSVYAEELGFEVLAIGEHHFNDYIIPSPFPVLSAVAARTSRIRLTTGVTLLPMLDAVRVAEDFATLDQISNGRAEMVLGRGISADGYAEFGVEQDKSRDMLVEKLELVRRLFTEESVVWSGASRPDLNGITLKPFPAQRTPSIWMGTGMSEESVRWTAAMGMPLMLPSIFKRAEEWKDMIALYRELMVENGYEEQSFVGACSHIHVAPTSQQARDEKRPYLTSYADWANQLRGVDVKVDFDRLINGPALVGSPAEVVDRLESIKEALQPDRHLAVFDIGGMPESEVRATMDLYAAEVMTKVR
ncbi:LLM class flavin-dependent oxidoreductase [Gordonia sp. CPCC 206044]|uniref:LLM class flavin-dependent oxidoreductase n=1 Tax=Gordonia sp. CPCC 206044 TaxID=3140793 RepID=UPI003AF3440E